MKSVAILPLRSGSKGILQKNTRRILGRPLYLWTLTEAIFSNLDKIYVFTDDENIIGYLETNFAWTDKIKCIIRSEESASDTATTEMAMNELAEKINYEFDIFCLLQATSPFTTRDYINETLKKVENGQYDSALTVVNYKRFIWSENGESLNYEYFNRPRRQDFKGMLIENGAIYACSKAIYMKTKNRLGGRIGIVKMEENSLTEIDEPEDLIVVEQLLKRKLKNAVAGFSQIKHLCLDVDGVLTKGTVHVSKEGELSKEFSLRDGMGIQLLRESGVDILVMTSEKSTIVEQRMKKLGIADCYMGVQDKYAFLENILHLKNINRKALAYIGDDINDLSNIISCGLGLCPADAEATVKECADFILNRSGGERAVREACDFIIKLNKKINQPKDV